MTTLDIAHQIIAEIKEKNIDPKNAIAIVQHVAKAVRGDRDAALEVLNCIAKGPDGIVRTEDDVFDAETLNHLKFLLDSELAGKLVTALSSKKWWCC